MYTSLTLQLKRLYPQAAYQVLRFHPSQGFFFPVCECGIVPVVAGLIRKGMPVSNAVTMLLSIPVVNLVTFTSTYYAFPSSHGMAVLRFVGGVTISFIIGLLVSYFVDDKSALKKNQDSSDYLPIIDGGFVLFKNTHKHGCSCHDHDHDHHDHHAERGKNAFAEKPLSVLRHSVEEFFETGKYFIAGILITAMFQTFVPKNSLSGVAGRFPLPELFMSGYAYMLSICSQTDAFVARSMSSYFGPGALLCFMISGGMIDIKTTMMMRSIFRKRFILLLAIMVVILTITYSTVATVILR